MKKILFHGRVSPIKSLETPIEAISKMKYKDEVCFEIVGPAEEKYLEKLKILINKLNLKDKVIFSGAIESKDNSHILELIKKIDTAFIWVLPSISEGGPYSLMEAMARERLCVVSEGANSQCKLIQDGKTGFLFRTKDSQHLADVFDMIIYRELPRIIFIHE